MDKLLNCPSCLGKPTVDLAKTPMGIRYYSIVCKDCGLATKHWCESSKQKAYDSWNNRPREAELLETIAELREALKPFADEYMVYYKPNDLTCISSNPKIKELLDKTKEFDK